MLLVDAHVHIYDCFNLETFFDSAYANFKAEAVRQGCQNNFTGILLLTETSKDNWFQTLTDYSDKKTKVGPWTFLRTEEDSSLRAQRSENEALCLISGSQIVTSENLEVLALMTASRFPDGHGILSTIEQVRGQGGIPVIPWGFGKCTGKRSKVVQSFIQESRNEDLFLGDNGGRTAYLPCPSHFKIADSKGIRILSGSDPLPFSSEPWRAGSFGFSLDGFLDRNKPGENLERILCYPISGPRPFGRLERPNRFFRNQFVMQYLKLRNTRHQGKGHTSSQHRVLGA